MTNTPATLRIWLFAALESVLDNLTSFQGVNAFIRLLSLLPLRKPILGMYQVLDHQVELELCDISGKKAIYRKTQMVRFLQDNIIAYEDKAWGDGEIFTAYRCSPGLAVDCYADGHRYRVLISLREQKHRGDVETFRIEREITSGFTNATEDFQTEVDHQTEQLSLAVLFPVARPPQDAWIVEQNTGRRIPLGPSHREALPDGRLRLRWQIRRPRRYEAYVLRWAW